MKTSSKLIKGELDKIFPHPKCPLNYEEDYELLLAVMLSAQTTDERVNEVTKKLFKYSLSDLAKLDLAALEKIIKPVGMGHRKASYVSQIAKRLVAETGGKVPNDRNYIENLPGVGHKTCNVVLSELFKVPALAVDTHVSRVSKRLDLASEDADVEEIENKLCAFFDEADWREVHIQLVLFGRHICKASKPLCADCPFKNSICKKSQDNLKS